MDSKYCFYRLSIPNGPPIEELLNSIKAERYKNFFKVFNEFDNGGNAYGYTHWSNYEKDMIGAIRTISRFYTSFKNK